MKLTADNYYSPEANLEYFSVSQYKAFSKCEAAALAEIDGKYHRPETKALLMGSYVDAHFSGEMGVFIRDNPQIFNSRTGELKAEYKQADKCVQRAESDPMFMSYMDGEKQVIMTGELFGQPWKVKLDVLHNDKIVDLKLMRDMKPVYTENGWETFIDAWDYDVQAYVYQQIVLQNTGKLLPFYFAIITKEEHPNIALIEMTQWKINSVEQVMEHFVRERFANVKAKHLDPIRCEHCDYCHDTKKLTTVIKYEDLLEDKL